MFYDIWVGKEYVRGTIVAGQKIVASESTFVDDNVRKWAESMGVVLPVGCAWTCENAILEQGCGFRVSDGVYKIILPNGFTFPIIQKDDGLFICGVTVPCSSVVRTMIAVRVYESQDDFVRFRLVIFDGSLRVPIDNIIYDKEGVICNGNRVSNAKITKYLVLGVKYA